MGFLEAIYNAIAFVSLLVGVGFIIYLLAWGMLWLKMITL